LTNLNPLGGLLETPLASSQGKINDEDQQQQQPMTTGMAHVMGMATSRAASASI